MKDPKNGDKMKIGSLFVDGAKYNGEIIAYEIDNSDACGVTASNYLVWFRKNNAELVYDDGMWNWKALKDAPFNK